MGTHSPSSLLDIHMLILRAGGLLSLDSFVKTFPEIDAVHITTANGFSQSEANHVSLIQGISVASYNLVRVVSFSKLSFLNQ